MPPELIHFHGTYRYRSQGELDNAVAAACRQLDDEELGDPEQRSLRCLIKQGLVLSVDMFVPAAAEVRFAAANLFEALAAGAVEGAVDSDLGAHRLDSFPSGLDD